MDQQLLLHHAQKFVEMEELLKLYLDTVTMEIKSVETDVAQVAELKHITLAQLAALHNHQPVQIPAETES